MTFEEAVKKMVKAYWEDEEEFFENSELGKLDKTKYTKEYFRQYENVSDVKDTTKDKAK